jgi:peptide methionine sulfoxide reductase MsrA
MVNAADFARHWFSPMTTQIRLAPPYHYAEDYHQQHLKKHMNG